MTRFQSPHSLTFAQRQARRKAWVSRRRFLVKVRPLALAAAVALGASSPMVLGQTVITPLKGVGQTQTVVSTQGNQTTVTTQSLRDGNAFSTYSNFTVGQGDQVKMLVPKDANWWVNIVRDAQVRVDGRLESRLANGSIGGNLLFIDSHGFAILDELRSHFPHVQSMLMDRATLLANAALHGEEPLPLKRDLPRLSSDEQQLYNDLRDQRLGKNLRLEQEQIPFHLLQRALERLADPVRQTSAPPAPQHQ